MERRFKKMQKRQNPEDARPSPTTTLDASQAHVDVVETVAMKTNQEETTSFGSATTPHVKGQMARTTKRQCIPKRKCFCRVGKAVCGEYSPKARHDLQNTFRGMKTLDEYNFTVTARAAPPRECDIGITSSPALECVFDKLSGTRARMKAKKAFNTTTICPPVVTLADSEDDEIVCLGTPAVCSSVSTEVMNSEDDIVFLGTHHPSASAEAIGEMEIRNNPQISPNFCSKSTHPPTGKFKVEPCPDDRDIVLIPDDDDATNFPVIVPAASPPAPDADQSIYDQSSGVKEEDTELLSNLGVDSPETLLICEQNYGVETKDSNEEGILNDSNISEVEDDDDDDYPRDSHCISEEETLDDILLRIFDDDWVDMPCDCLTSDECDLE